MKLFGVGSEGLPLEIVEGYCIVTAFDLHARVAIVRGIFIHGNASDIEFGRLFCGRQRGKIVAF